MVKIGSVVWPGLVGIGAGIIKGKAAFLDFAKRADAIEIGSITKDLCEGNSGQTVWKYPEQKSLRHNAGLPNPGALGIVTQLKAAQLQIEVPWGLNLAVTPGISDTNLAVADISQTLQICLEGGLKPAWVTLNVSSPDTQDPVTLLSEPSRVWALTKAMQAILDRSKKAIPLWLKIGPSLHRVTYAALGEVCLRTKIEAIIACNTLPDPKGEPGGWCGQSVQAVSRAVVWEMKQVTQGKIPLIAAGGVANGSQVVSKLSAGATAVQVVSALLFRGRDAATRIKREYELLTAKALLREANKG